MLGYGFALESGGSVTQLLTIDEVAELLRVKAGTVRLWRAQGLLRAVKYPGASNTRVVFQVSEIERFLSVYQEGSESCDSLSCEMESAGGETAGSSGGGTGMAASESRRLELATIGEAPSGSGRSGSERHTREWLRGAQR